MSDDQFDVVVVGAGLSGLSAARRLQKRNSQLSVLVLEARGVSHARKHTFIIDILLSYQNLHMPTCIAMENMMLSCFLLAAYRPCRG